MRNARVPGITDMVGTACWERSTWNVVQTPKKGDMEDEADHF
jgi:hypothetical protein